MNLHDRAEFERRLEAHVDAALCMHAANAERYGIEIHNTRCDLITWVEAWGKRSHGNIAGPPDAAPITDTSGGP